MEEEIQQFEDAKDRTEQENLANVYGFIRATECLESIYEKDSCQEDEYLKSCNRLILSFKSALGAAKKGSEQYFDEYSLKDECPRAYNRLVTVGAPQETVQTKPRSEVKIIAETTQSFITAMDAIKLGQKAKDELAPVVSEIVLCLNRVPGLPSSFSGKSQLKHWSDTLGLMKAHEELSEDDARQMLYDIEQSYSSFHDFLDGPNK